MRYFNLFSNIMVTRGYSRILISDLQRDVSELCPPELYDLLEELKKQSIEQLMEAYDEDSREIVNDYLEFLLKKEYGFITENDWDRNFPPLSYDYHDHSMVNNLFLELSDIGMLENLRPSMESLSVRHLVVYSKTPRSLEELLMIDHYFKQASLESIEIIAPYHDAVDKYFVQTLNNQSTRIYNLVFYSCSKATFDAGNTFRFTVHFTEQALSISSCGKVSMNYLDTNLSKVLEAINHNSCLHKKIAVDSRGHIRNCPAMPQSFGNIRETTLEAALQHPEFRQYWNLTKDQIAVCKDCEFRYICTDCRAYTELTHTNNEGLDISKPLKCGYNPYKGEWEEWSSNPLKQKAIDYYGLPEGKQ